MALKAERTGDFAPARLLAIGKRLQGQAVADRAQDAIRRIEYEIDRGETRTLEFHGNVNANGRILVLETEEGEFLPESNAILFYLADGTPFLPEDLLGKARSHGMPRILSHSCETAKHPSSGSAPYWA